MSELTTLSLGCGLQSSTIVEMIVEGKLPKIDYAIFADTGDEPDYVYTQRDYLKKRLESVDIPLVTVRNKETIIDAIFHGKGQFASIPAYTEINGSTGMMRRQCTREYKIAPIEKFIRETLLEGGNAKRTKSNQIRVNKGVSVISWIGITVDEATRMRTNRTKWIENRWPLIDLLLIDSRMSRLDCANWLTEHNLPIPGRSSCRICPFHSHNHWKDVKKNRPDDWSHVLKVDGYLREENRFTAGIKADMFLYKGAIPLEDVDFAKDDQQEDFFELCDGGYCFI